MKIKKKKADSGYREQIRGYSGEGDGAVQRLRNGRHKLWGVRRAQGRTVQHGE